MKNKKVILSAVTAAMILAVTACSGTKEETLPAQTEAEETTAKETVPAQIETVTAAEEIMTDQDTSKAENTVTGTVSQIKDFMFILTTDNEKSYAMPFDDENPIDMSGIKVNDQVTVTYQGVLSDTDNGELKIISVQK